MSTRAGWGGSAARAPLYAGIVILAAIGVAALGIWKGSFAAGDGDAFGYVSQANLIAHGSLHIEQQFVRTLPWPFADWSFAPAGYRPGTTRGVIVPTYPPGLPLTMAGFQRLGGQQAVFYVVPLLGALCIWMTGQLGTVVHGRLTGVLAAVMLAASPSFLYQLVQPMSDVPAAAWWTLALVLAMRNSGPAALGAGMAASAAILTRPNLVPLAAVIAAYFAGGLARRGGDRRRAAIQLACFAAAAVPGCVAVAAVNEALYGSPFSSGYEPFDSLYALNHLGQNLDRYPRWLVQTQSPFIGLALVAPWIAALRRSPGSERPPAAADLALLLSFAAVVFLSYLFYLPFGRDEWTYLRFLLPAYPALLVLAVAVAVEMARRVISRERTATTAAVLVCVALSAWLARESIERGVLRVQLIERRYRDVGYYVAALLPANSVLIAHLHAGSIRHYSGRLTLNFRWLERRWLDAAVKELGDRGYHPLIALEEGEVESFRERFGTQNALGRLDWPPMAERTEPIRVHIFDPADRIRFQRGENVVTRSIERSRSW